MSITVTCRAKRFGSFILAEIIHSDSKKITLLINSYAWKHVHCQGSLKTCITYVKRLALDDGAYFILISFFNK